MAEDEPRTPAAGDAGPIVVAGDAVVDWLEASVEPSSDKRSASNWRQHPGCRRLARRGGALLLADMVRQAAGSDVIAPQPTGLEQLAPEQVLHCTASMAPFPVHRDKADKDDPKVLRIVRRGAVSGPADGTDPRPLPLSPPRQPRLIVIDDAGNGFRSARDVWEPLLETAGPETLILYKMGRPLAAGGLWRKVRNTMAVRTVVLVNADDLRAEGIHISRRLSWERAAEDFVRGVGANGALVGLATTPNLIIRLCCDGVIHHRTGSPAPTRLHFDPARAEGEFAEEHPGEMMGATDAFAAALAASLARGGIDELDAGIRLGFKAQRQLYRLGFGAARESAPAYPIAGLFADGADDGPEAVDIPADLSSRVQGEWSILDQFDEDLVKALAFKVARLGPGAALQGAPMARFGELVTADRSEIESYRSIANLVREYLATPGQEKPLSIAVFGPPGSGKSYGVTQVAQAIDLEKRVDKMTFNVAQFAGPEDLALALHRVRDVAVRGRIPLVFFDEFDSALDGELGWLKYFLAPMQDGEFRQGSGVHPIGRAVFVFAGGTTHRFENFKDGDEAVGVSAKRPDFISRLRGYVDVMGPDPTGDAGDRRFPIRRAMILRNLIQKREKRLFSNDTLNIDEGVLRAFLQIGRYHHGARSIEAILGMSTLTGRTAFDQSALPSRGQLELHVDAQAFLGLVAAESPWSQSERTTLGKGVHDAYVAFRRGLSARSGQEADASLKTWEELDPHLRESNCRQADGIPQLLRAIGCYIGREGRANAIDVFSPSQIDDLAELEHERFCSERLQQQWLPGPRNPLNHTSDSLKPWNDLSEATQDLDRNAVKQFPMLLRMIGRAVYPIDERT